MTFSGLNLSMFWLVFNVSTHVILLCCSSFLYSSFLTTATSIQRGNETDRHALLEFKAKITRDPLRVLSSWNETTHFCQWTGVKCGSRHQRVIILGLQSAKIEGSISPFIGNLSFLRLLYLYNNGFSREIPPEIGRLRRLRTVYLDNNTITGEIPTNVSGCSDLIDLDVGFNSLVGNIPVEFVFLKKLQRIVVQANYLTGVFPTFLGNLSSLEEIGVTGNIIGGSIPDGLGRLRNLRYLALGATRLSGTIPPSIFNISSLEAFDIVLCQIKGTIPSDIGITLPNLFFLGFGSNQFTGLFPVSISNASKLEVIALGRNNLVGKVPNLDKLNKLRFFGISRNQLGTGKADDLNFLSSLTNTTRLEVLGLDGNNFGGEFPISIGNLSLTLAKLRLNENRIFGSIPTGIGNLVNLDILYLSNNQLTGNIPQEFGKLQKLVEVHLSENKLSGKIPLPVGNLSLLTILDLSKNNLEGNIPSILEKCQSLIFLDLSRNNLSGTIPRQVISLSSLSLTLNLSQNHFEGSLPMEVGILKNLGTLDVSNNILSGEIPSSLSSCVRLEILNLEGNFFRGSIPSSFSSLRGIQVLDLSRNNLSGEIPRFMEDFVFLQKLDLSYNNFEGVVPTKGVFKNASAISVVGNDKLCGGIPELLQPTCNSKGSKERKSTITFTFIISITCGLVGLLLILCLLYLCWFKRTRKEGTSNEPDNSLLKMSYQSLLKATDGFSSENLIGVGSFGSVFKGVLDHDGTIVAVKVLNLLRHGAAKSFIAECETLRNIRHRNLVKVLTACSGVDYKGNDFKALVYEFMVNSSLDEWLHPNENGSELAIQKLNFLQRINIAIDVACALDYLHHHCETPIVHCDLKPSNVLLDNEMIGHVGDFGLSKFVYESSLDLFTSQTSSIGVRGSIGYTAPEYGMGSEVSRSGDVYSYGVLLLEMFTGKRPTDEMFKDGLNLHRFVQVALPDTAVEIADPTLANEIEEEHRSSGIHKFHECLVSIFGIGIACSAESARERMNIEDVVAELNSIKVYLETGIQRSRVVVKLE